MARVLVGCLLAVVVACALAAVFCRPYLLALGLEFGYGSGPSIEVEPPPTERPTALERTAARMRIVDEVLSGRLSLTAAAEELRRADGEVGPRILANAPGVTDGEKLRRMVISWVENTELSRGGAPVVARRLWAELDDWLAAGGGATANDMPGP